MPRIEMVQVYKQIESRRAQQIETAIKEKKESIPYSFTEFKFDMMADDLVLSIPTIRNKWDAARAKGIITVCGESKPYQKALLNVRILLKNIGNEETQPSKTLVRDIHIDRDIDRDIDIQQTNCDAQSSSMLSEKENTIISVIRERFKIARGRPVSLSKIIDDMVYENLDKDDAYHGVELLKSLGQIREITPGQYEEVKA